MQDGVKSTLVVGSQHTKQSDKSNNEPPSIEYKQVNNIHDHIGELSDQEKQAEFNKQHQQYVKMKLQRKKELIRVKKEEFGPSSSDDDGSSSEQEIGQIKGVKKVISKKSEAKSQGKPEIKEQQKNSYHVILELKKTTIETQLIFMEKELTINNRTFNYVGINKLGLTKGSVGNRIVYRMKMGIGSDEGVISLNQNLEKGGTRMSDIFLRLMRAKLDLKTTKFIQKSRCSAEQLGELKEGALICDRIFKKSQVFGKWEQRFVVIRPQGLYSFRSIKQKPTMQIPLVQISELLTYFEWFKETLVVKLFYNGTKTDFGLPLDSKLGWMVRFLGLIQ